eukprot:760302-Hanusia_phi.AAC.3
MRRKVRGKKEDALELLPQVAPEERSKGSFLQESCELSGTFASLAAEVAEALREIFHPKRSFPHSALTPAPSRSRGPVLSGKPVLASAELSMHGVPCSWDLSSFQVYLTRVCGNCHNIVTLSYILNNRSGSSTCVERVSGPESRAPS